MDTFYGDFGVMHDPRFKLIDLFSGCGGMTLGFVWDRSWSERSRNQVCAGMTRESSPFSVVLANDFNDAAISTYRHNFDRTGEHSVSGSVENLLQGGNEIPKADVVIGGPPCQGFSLLNRNRSGDQRRELWVPFLDVADECEAKIIVMENVPQLLGSEEFERIKERLRQRGFSHLMAHVLCSADFGVPQVRYRAIIMASRTGPISLPLPTHAGPKKLKLQSNSDLFKLPLRPWTSVRLAIGDLLPPIGTELRAGVSETYRLHFGRLPTATSVERYKAVPAGGNRFDLLRNRPDLTPQCWIKKKSGGTDLFGRLWWDRPSVTIRTEFFKPEKGRYLHPVEDRPITHREAARIQSFPDQFEFEGSKVEIAKQIGNAVPPLLAYHISNSVVNCLNGITTIDDMRATAEAYATDLNDPVQEIWFDAPIHSR